MSSMRARCSDAPIGPSAVCHTIGPHTTMSCHGNTPRFSWPRFSPELCLVAISTLIALLQQYASKLVIDVGFAIESREAAALAIKIRAQPSLNVVKGLLRSL